MYIICKYTRFACGQSSMYVILRRLKWIGQQTSFKLIKISKAHDNILISRESFLFIVSRFRNEILLSNSGNQNVFQSLEIHLRSLVRSFLDALMYICQEIVPRGSDVVIWQDLVIRRITTLNRLYIHCDQERNRLSPLYAMPRVNIQDK